MTKCYISINIKRRLIFLNQNYQHIYFKVPKITKNFVQVSREKNDTLIFNER